MCGYACVNVWILRAGKVVKVRKGAAVREEEVVEFIPEEGDLAGAILFEIIEELRAIGGDRSLPKP
jgi:hypothetical protein